MHVILSVYFYIRMRFKELRTEIIDETEALVALAHTPHLGSIKIRLLLRHFGSAVAALAADPLELGQLPGFGDVVMHSFREARSSQPWHESLDLAHRQNVRIIPFTDPSYPKGLFDLVDYPVVLYIKGQLHQQDNHGLAVVGTRQASLYGNEMGYKLSRDLAASGFTIVSGLARGIDTQAHRAALAARGRTIAVIGSGLSNIYPSENTGLAEQIATEGVLISEFPMTTPPDRQNFPQRNRLVATMTRGTVLIEAPAKSGAMITVHRALAHRRAVFALPGRADVDSFHGNHALIKEGHAKLIENAHDIAASFSDLFVTQRPIMTPSKPDVFLEPEEKKLLDLLPPEETSIEDLVHKAQLPVMKLNVLLMSLILKKVIREFPGKLYKRVI